MTEDRGQTTDNGRQNKEHRTSNIEQRMQNAEQRTDDGGQMTGLAICDPSTTLRTGCRLPIFSPPAIFILTDTGALKIKLRGLAHEGHPLLIRNQIKTLGATRRNTKVLTTDYTDLHGFSHKKAQKAQIFLDADYAPTLFIVPILALRKNNLRNILPSLRFADCNKKYLTMCPRDFVVKIKVNWETTLDRNGLSTGVNKKIMARYGWRNGIWDVMQINPDLSGNNVGLNRHGRS